MILRIGCLGVLLAVAQISSARCSDFATHQEAQAYFNAKRAGYLKLDRDHDGIACEHLKGGHSKKSKKAKHVKHGKKNQAVHGGANPFK